MSKLAINGGNKVRNSSFPAWPHYDETEREALNRVLDSRNWWANQGTEVKAFEKEWTKFTDAKASFAVTNGTHTLEVIFLALGIGEGDEVIVADWSFLATISTILTANAIPKIVDVDPLTGTIDVKQAEAAITSKTKAVFSSPVLGNPYDYDRLLEICDKNNIKLIADNCDSLGSKWKDEYLTKHAVAASCSFYPAHHISTGEGGMVSSNDTTFIDTVRSFSWWGRDCYCIGSNNQLPCGTCGNRFDRWLDGYDGIIDHKYIFANMGYNLKPLDLQGAIGLAQLEKADFIDQKRREHKKRLENLLKKYLMIRVPDTLPNADPSWFGVPIICETQQQKESLVAHFEDNKIQTRNYFAGNILLHPGYKHLDDANKYPLANKALSHVFILGCPPFWNDKVFNYIEDVLKSWKQK